MPHRPSPRRAIGALAIAVACSLATMPPPTLALDPPRPLPGYHPAFVTEREPGVWEDCIWAAASMLLDKWTNGRTIVGRERLRGLSGDKDGGSNLANVARAFAKVGITMPFSPLGGDSISWRELLDRLGHGGGAILLGDYGQLPRRYGRWDPGFWSNTGPLDDHALYLDGFDRKRGRVLVLDPLAPAGWAGEWVPVSALKRFAWKGRGGALWVAMTPAAQAAPFDGVELGDAVATADATSLQVSWPITVSPRDWTFQGATVAAAIEPATDAGPTDVVVAAQPPLAASAAPAVAADASSAAAAVADGMLTATVPLPSPGVYEVSVSLTERRFGQTVAVAGPFRLYVPGPRAAAYSAPGELTVEPGVFVVVPVLVRNSGSESWAEPASDPWRPPELQPRRNTRLVGTWIAEVAPPASDHDRGVPPGPLPVVFGSLDLEPGHGRVLEALVRVPVDPGTWHLVLDVVDDEIGSLARAGSAPGDVVVVVLAPGIR